MEGFWLLPGGVLLVPPSPIILLALCNLCELIGEEVVEMLDIGDKTIEWLFKLFTPMWELVKLMGTCLFPNESVVTIVAPG